MDVLQVVLNCILKKDLQYTKANPTFHHWWTENQRFGLTFQSSADARMLERGVCKAMENMLSKSTVEIAGFLKTFNGPHGIFP